jgi:lysylphosphatidylglycerol synthetase-like protein (DUF2156 family)
MPRTPGPHKNRRLRTLVATTLFAALALASLAGLDTALRDHFSGFRSHSALLGALPAVVVAFLCALLGAAPAVTLVAALVAFAAGFYAFRAQFKRRTGVGFRV